MTSVFPNRFWRLPSGCLTRPSHWRQCSCTAVCPTSTPLVCISAFAARCASAPHSALECDCLPAPFPTIFSDLSLTATTTDSFRYGHEMNTRRPRRCANAAARVESSAESESVNKPGSPPRPTRRISDSFLLAVPKTLTPACLSSPRASRLVIVGNPGGRSTPSLTPGSKQLRPPKHARFVGNSPGGMLSNALDLQGNKPGNTFGSVDGASPAPAGAC